ncbi:MAG: hypothetical protein GEV04_16595 [Actinophytocola sp.]|nr:hypothetical protein [Actinophytocola sp.]
MRAVSSVTLPAELVREPGNLPKHCSRHGRPADTHADFSLQVTKRPAGGAGLTNNAFSTKGRKPRTLYVTGWPLCPACARSRAVWFTATMVLFFGGVVAFFGALAVQIAADNPPVNALALTAMIGFIAMVVAWLPFYLSGYPRLTKANPSPDGESVVVISPSEEFRADLTG